MGTFTIDSKSEKTTLASTDQCLLQETSAGAVKKFVLTSLATYVFKQITSQTGKTTPDTTDEIVLQESATVIKKITIANLYAYILGLIKAVILKPETVLKSSSYAVLDNDGFSRIECDTTSGDVTITLPLKANNAGRRIMIANIKGGTNKVIVIPHASDSNKLTDDGLSAVWLPKVGDFIEIQESANSGFWDITKERVTCQAEFDTYAGYGSTDNKIVRYTNNPVATGNLYTENHSTGYSSNAKGLEITIQKSGRYALQNFWNSSDGTACGLSVNSNQLTTSVLAITGSHRKSYSNIGSSVGGGYSAVWSGYLKKGDVIRPHNAGNAPSVAGATKFYLEYMG